MADGREALLALRVSGDLVGEMSALNGTPRSATVTTCRPSTFSIIHGDQFRSFLRGHPDAAVEVAGIVAERLRWSNRRRLDFASYPIKIRLARILADLAAGLGRLSPSGLAIDVRLTQPELATLCGAADTTIEKALRDLRDNGIVGTGYQQIVILDLPALRRLADLHDGGW
jgi:CRP/FNR family transcriptional regulator, cyclic AMP receptor protein